MGYRRINMEQIEYSAYYMDTVCDKEDFENQFRDLHINSDPAFTIIEVRKCLESFLDFIRGEATRQSKLLMDNGFIDTTEIEGIKLGVKSLALSGYGRVILLNE